MTTPRRLVFGEVADSYDRHRPTYPDALIDDLAVLPAAAGRALEAGAGTGKATRLLAARGVPIVAVEPSPGMARIVRERCAQWPGVSVVQSDFETFDPAGERFGLVYSAQAWHWIDPARRAALARAALAPGGRLAAFWNRPAWGDSSVRRALSDVYRRVAPAMDRAGSMHPDNHDPIREPWDAWEREIGAAAGLANAEQRHHRWELTYDGEGYAGMLSTLSEVRLLDGAVRERLLEGVARAIDAEGRLAMPMVTVVLLARAV